MTPLMEQYQSIKNNYKDFILLFQMGDFYETFYEDAKQIAKILNITLTCREKKNNTPMAGFPIKAIDEYLPKLINSGKKIAIAQQTENSKDAIGIVQRKVTKVITPGTITDVKALQNKQNNFLMCIYFSNKNGHLATEVLNKDNPKASNEKILKDIALAFADISTGDFYVNSWQSLSSEKLLEIVKKINPSEILLSDKKPLDFLQNFLIQSYKSEFFKFDKSYSYLCEKFNMINLDSFALKGKDNAVIACSILWRYLEETQFTKPFHITKIKWWKESKYLYLDTNTYKNLEILNPTNQSSNGNFNYNSLQKVLDNTITSMGSRLLNNYLLNPLISKKLIETRLLFVKNFIQNPDILKITIANLKFITCDLSRFTGLIGLQKINPKQIIQLKHSLKYSLKLFEDLKIFNNKSIQNLLKNLDLTLLSNLILFLENTILENPEMEITQGNIFKETYNDQIKHYRNLTTNINKTLDEIIKEEKQKYQINNMKIGYNRVFGYYFEVSNSNKGKLPEEYIRKQTLSNGERYITPKLKNLETEILQAYDKLSKLEYELFKNLQNELLKYIKIIQDVNYLISKIDVLSCFAFNALEYNYCMPKIVNSKKNKKIICKNTRHPIVERFNQNNFISNNIKLDQKNNNFIILTGPNMAGKSTYVRQIALICFMAQIGSYVPASYAKINIIDKIFARIGASDDISTGRSTFMVEMSETANIINQATKNSLIILDELGRGTSTYDGLSLAWAISEYIHNNIKAKTIFATHYHEITELSKMYNGIQNYCVQVQEKGDTVYFLHNIKKGKADKSYGIYVAKLVGFPKEIINKAKQVLEDLEKNKTKTIVIKQKSLL